jgi:hypothetical protein
VYAEHPVFSPPEPQAKLWRYMDFTKYVSLLDSRALFFSRADLLGDPFEGSYAQANLDLRLKIYSDTQLTKALEQLTKFRQALPRQMYINCWHKSEYESAAMWKLHLRDNGIAIQTTFQALTASFTGDEDVYAGVVNYVDFQTTPIPEGNAFWPFVHKRRSFDYEQEVRAVISRFVVDQIDPDRPVDPGLLVPVDLAGLVHRVCIAPDAPTWFAELVTAVTSRFGVDAVVSQSDLAGDPVY